MKNLLLSLMMIIAVFPAFSQNTEELSGENNSILENIMDNMVYVEGGTFTMGSKGINAYKDEKPAHQITVSSFYINKYEVTQKQWVALMGSNPSYFKGDDLPVDQVSWDDAQEFISKLNQLTGKKYRLPTEAEWEFAAIGGNKSKGYKYAGSNDLDCVAWYGRNSELQPHPTGQKQANELGLHDMNGNVWEWCSDWYGRYTFTPRTNPSGPSFGFCRVLRGGSCDSVDSSCRFRMANAPGDRHCYWGFRLALAEF